MLLDAGGKHTVVDARTTTNIWASSIGARYDFGPDGFMSGMMADVRAYNRALSDAEVYEFYHNPWELYRPNVPYVLGKISAVGSQTVEPSSVSSIETFGSATVLPGTVTVLPTGIASTESFGSLTIVLGTV